MSYRTVRRSVSVFELTRLQFVANDFAFFRVLRERSSGQQQHSQTSFHRRDPRRDFTAKDAKGAKTEDQGCMLFDFLLSSVVKNHYAYAPLQLNAFFVWPPPKVWARGPLPFTDLFGLPAFCRPMEIFLSSTVTAPVPSRPPTCFSLITEPILIPKQDFTSIP